LGERVNGIHEVGGSTPPGSTNLREGIAANSNREGREGCPS
jgi:hypothetical protein